MRLEGPVRSRTSSTVLPLTAADIIDADDWLIEQPWPLMRMSSTTPSSHVEVDHDLVAAQRVEPLDPVGRGRLELAAVPGVAVVVEDDLSVQVFEAGHGGVLGRVLGERLEGEEVAGRARGRRPGRRCRIRRCTRRARPGRWPRRRGGASAAWRSGARPARRRPARRAPGTGRGGARRGRRTRARRPRAWGSVGPWMTSSSPNALGQGAQGIGGEGDLVLAHGVHAQVLEVVDGRAQADHLGDGRRAGLELPRDVVGRPAVEADVADHLAAAQEGGHGLEQLVAGPQHARCRSGPASCGR